MIGRGRPKKNMAKHDRVEVRLSREESKMLEFVCTKTGATKSEVLRNGLKMQYDYHKLVI